METNQQNRDTFDECQTSQVIKEMIQVSRKKLTNNGILFILWGWILFYSGIIGYIGREVFLTYNLQRILDKSGIALGLFALAFTVYYFWKQRIKVQTYIGISLGLVWISMFVGFVLINLIQFNVLQEVNFELQHPLFMVIMAFAIVVTGGILRFRPVILGGIIFGLLALISSYLPLPYQLLLESCAWLIAFVIPGHYLYAKRNS